VSHKGFGFEHQGLPSVLNEALYSSLESSPTFQFHVPLPHSSENPVRWLAIETTRFIFTTQISALTFPVNFVTLGCCVCQQLLSICTVPCRLEGGHSVWNEVRAHCLYKHIHSISLICVHCDFFWVNINFTDGLFPSVVSSNKLIVTQLLWFFRHWLLASDMQSVRSTMVEFVWCTEHFLPCTVKRHGYTGRAIATQRGGKDCVISWQPNVASITWPGRGYNI